MTSLLIYLLLGWNGPTLPSDTLLSLHNGKARIICEDSERVISISQDLNGYFVADSGDKTARYYPESALTAAFADFVKRKSEL